MTPTAAWLRDEVDASDATGRYDVGVRWGKPIAIWLGCAAYTGCGVPDEAVGMGSAADGSSSGSAGTTASTPGATTTPVGTGGAGADGSTGAETSGPAAPATTGDTDGDTAAGSDTCGDGSCAADPVCGNGIVEGPEACDEGAANADDAACTASCAVAVCGDGLVRAGIEECDQPQNLGDCTAACELCDETVAIGEGPIWNNPDAQDKCPGICAAVGGDWEGAWWTVTPNQFSVCQCLDVCPDAVPG